MKIVTIVGARPQFIKAAAVSRVIRRQRNIREVILHTGQHFDQNMSEIFFRELEIPTPNYNLGINGTSHGAMTGRMLEGIEKILSKENPDWVLVYGDTNSTLAGALAAKKLHIKVAHVEAGLRSFNMKMPEEVNRIVADRISDVLFCPTETSVKNLHAEGFKNFPCRIVRSGDVMFDAALYYSGKAEKHSSILQQLSFTEFALCTLHREENTNDERILKRLITALNKINSQLPVVLPLHPRTKKMLKKISLKCNCFIIDPVGYFDMLLLLQHCKLVLTDSGGLQKEAFFFKKNCITLREQTEWIELVKAKCNVVAGSDEEKIIAAFHHFMKRKSSNFGVKLYGDGKASEKIVQTLRSA